MKILILTNTDISNKNANGLARIICNYLEYLNSKNIDYKIINISDKKLIKTKKSADKIKRYILSFVPYVTINKYYSFQQIYNYIKPYLLSYDKLQIFGYALDYKVLNMIKKHNLDINLILIDSLTLLRFRSIIYTFNLLKLPINIFELIKCFNYEIYAKKNFKKVSYVSKVDANFVSCFKSKNTKINVISNGVDFDYYCPSLKEIGSMIRLIFYGDLNYKPNKDCVRYVVNRLNNLLLKSKSMPKYEIFLIGKSDEINYLNNFKNVNATGFVNDLRKYFNSKTIFICPMRTGVGVKNKVLESIAMEVPIVVSPLCCAGISSKIHKHLFISNNENELRNNIIKISRNYEFYNRNSTLIKQFLKEEHSWEKICNRYYYS